MKFIEIYDSTFPQVKHEIYAKTDFRLFLANTLQLIVFVDITPADSPF